jgi:hypothetical protein
MYSYCPVPIRLLHGPSLRLVVVAALRGHLAAGMGATAAGTMIGWRVPSL